MRNSDLLLLERYTRQHAEEALAEIVRRHLDLVFSAALRQVRSPQLAEEGARKRVSRAVERLREFFARRGVTVGASGLVGLLSANAVQAAPAGLAATISAAAAFAGTGILATATATATKAIVMTTLQKSLITVTLVAIAGAGVYEARQASRLRADVKTLQQQQAPLAEHIQQLQRERDDATNELALLAGENERPNRNSGEVSKLRAKAGAAQAQARDWPG